MSNGLTGDYDVVVEVGVETVNRLLATVHQKSVTEDVSPKFLHSLTARVGSMPQRVQFELAEAVLGEYFGASNSDSGTMTEDALSNVQQDAVAAQAALTKLERNLSGLVKTPAAGSSLAESVTNVGAAISIVRGIAKIQVGTPTLTLFNGSTDEVTVHAQVRAHYIPDPGTAALPAPIHGEVRATFTAAYNPSGSTGKPAIEVKPSDDNNKITFIPTAGTLLTDSEAKRIAHQIRRFLRTKFKPMSAELPDDFPFKGFRSLIAGTKQAIALPLTGQQGSALNSLNNLFLGASDDFALAISHGYIEEQLEPFLDLIEHFSKTYRHHQEIFGVDTIPFAFHAWVSDAHLDWQQGAIKLTITGGTHVWGWAVPDDDYSFTIEQRLKLELDVSDQKISLTPDGDLSISGLPQKFKDKAKSAINQIFDLHDAQKEIRDALTNLSTNFNDALKSFDTAAHAKFTALEVGSDGVLLRGSLSLSSRPAVVVDFRETEGGKALTAFKSWIPAGTVENYAWSWVTRDPDSLLPWQGGKVQVQNDPHSFIFHPPILSGPGKQQRVDLHQVCLTVEGTQVGKGAVAGPDETTCTISTPDWMVAAMPAWWADLLLPHWGPDPGPEGILADQIAAHISVMPSQAAPSAETGTAAIVHFASGSSMAPLPVLGEALLASRLRDARIPMIVVLPLGSFDQKRDLVEARLGTFPRGLSTPLAITEDYEGSWTKAFKAPAGPTTYVMNAAGDLPWQLAGPLRAQALTAALDECGSAGRRGRSSLMRLRVRPGEPAPDIFIQDAAIRRKGTMLPPRLCGRRTLLLFWKSWSRPCLTELRRLQRVHSRAGDEGLAVVAIGDAEQPERVQAIAQEHGLSFTVLPDPTSEIARRYRVSCWPTTVWIDEQALIERVHFGLTPDRSGVTLR